MSRDRSREFPWMTDETWAEITSPTGLRPNETHLDCIGEYLRPDAANTRQLVHVISNRLEKTLARLLGLGASADRQSYDGDQKSLVYPVDRVVAVSCFPWSERMAEMVFEASADPFEMRTHRPVLSWAVEEPAAMKFLLSRGADPNQVSADGYHPIAFSSSHSDKHVSLLRVRASMRMLLDRGGDVDASLGEASGAPAVACAASKRRWPLVKLLLARGADPQLGGDQSLRSVLLGMEGNEPHLRWMALAGQKKLRDSTPQVARVCTSVRL